MNERPNEQTKDLQVRWLLRLRWAAIAGYVALIVLCALVLPFALPLVQLSIILLIAALSQLWGWLLVKRRPHTASSSLIAGLLVLDTLVLTGLLYFTGGAHNPFSAFYLIQIAVAASVLGAAWTWTLLCLAVSCFAALFWMYVPLPQPTGVSQGLSLMSLHFVGMFVAMVLTGACLAWFVTRLNMQLRERERVLHDMQIKAEHESRFASIVTLTAGVAHEINSPLATIAVAARELERDLTGGVCPAELAADTRLIRSEVERCREILGRLRTESAGDEQESTLSLDGQAIAQALAETIPPTYHERLAVISHYGTRTCRLPRAGLLQALGSLVRNAVEASPQDGMVRLEVSATNRRIVFTVLDTGPGLAASVIGRAGEPFLTTKEPGKGTGLGLFLVRRFADDVGGRFSIESIPGGGTSARLEVPSET